MFGALNRFISRLDSDTPSNGSRDGYTAWGFQVLRNNKPEIPVEPWYDFIIGINGRQIDNSDPSLFSTEVRNCAGANVTLTTYTAKGQRTSTVDIPIDPSSPSLGLTLQWSPLSNVDQVWHILEVTPNSPADTAGLLPYSDYIVGTPEGQVHGEAGLGELVEDYISRQLRLFVYNQEYGITRLITITPSRSWGGEGALGCVLGFGALHRLPAPLTEGPVPGPGESLFEGVRLSGEGGRPVSPYKETSGYNTNATPAQFSSNVIIPASLTSAPPLQPPTSAPATGPPRGGRRGKRVLSPTVAFDEYFKEGEQKSKEDDFVPTSKSPAPPPPPGTKGGSADTNDVTTHEEHSSAEKDGSTE
ncbi:uncharacterized protein KY384_002426 [Bacidia gigantensis]|uniref:uncharacterized protein n=1 Tax=Bacidia gigantensis TaxID=2732470 RepID=UPI001D039BF9|nr:uncharacterized protein KY384_002426 [Bacidia gigantensis]KAG8532549.1 hypothetical protein KY384_002426 [Bacidia gigantensis]